MDGIDNMDWVSIQIQPAKIQNRKGKESQTLSDGVLEKELYFWCGGFKVMVCADSVISSPNTLKSFHSIAKKIEREIKENMNLVGQFLPLVTTSMDPGISFTYFNGMYHEAFERWGQLSFVSRGSTLKIALQESIQSRV